MNTEMQMLLFTVILGLAQMILAFLFKAQKYGLAWAFSNRDQSLSAMEGVGARALRAFNNFLETFPLFAALILAAAAMGRHDMLTLWGAELYFWGRLIYLLVYLAGIKYLRTLIWLASILGLVLLLIALF